MIGHVFISHASVDRDSAEALRAAVEHAGVPCWIAPRNVPPGTRYAEAILEGIEECDLMLLVFSAHADHSPHICNEIEEATNNGKSILLVRTDATDPRANRQISLFLGSHQWYEASAGDLVSHAPRIVEAVVRLVEHERTLSRGTPEVPVAVIEPAPSSSALSASGQNRSIGIEVGATKIRGAVVDLDKPTAHLADSAIYFEQVEAPANARGVLEQTKAMVGRIIDEHFLVTPPVGIGIAAPGQVDLRVGTLKFGPNLFGARNVPFKTTLTSAFPGVPIRVDNEVRCATRCELHAGTGQDFDSFVCIYIGSGVGSGTVIDRRIYFGHNYCAGELGHVKIDAAGAPCACGQMGCLETFVKAQAVVSRAEAKGIDWESRGLKTLLSNGGETLTPLHIVEAIEAGDEAAQEVADEVAQNLGLGVANYLNLMNPAAVVLGGGLMRGFFLPMIDEITRALQRNALAEVANTPIVQSGLSENGMAIGAGFLFHPSDVWPF